MGISLAISICNTYFRDIEYLVGVLMNLVFWMTPITYPMSAIPENYRFIALINPLTSLMNLWRSIYLHNTISLNDLGVASFMAVIFLVIGLALFRRLEKRLDEVL